MSWCCGAEYRGDTCPRCGSGIQPFPTLGEILAGAATRAAEKRGQPPRERRPCGGCNGTGIKDSFQLSGGRSGGRGGPCESCNGTGVW